MSPNVPGTDVSMTAIRTESHKPAPRSAAESGEPAFDALVGLAVAATTPSRSRPPSPADAGQTADQGATDGLAGLGADATGAGRPDGAVPPAGTPAASQPAAPETTNTPPTPDGAATPAASAPEPGMTANTASPATGAPATDPRGSEMAAAAPAQPAAARPAVNPNASGAVPGSQVAATAAKPASAKALADSSAAKTEAAATASPATATGTTPSIDAPGMDQGAPAAMTLPGDTGGAAVSQPQETMSAEPRAGALAQAQASEQTPGLARAEPQAQTQAQAQAQAQASAPAQPQSRNAAPTGAAEQAMPEPASLKGDQPPVMATLSTEDATQQPVVAASTAGAAAAAAVQPASPEVAGRQSHARHGMDERDRAGPAARSKGKSAASQAVPASAQPQNTGVKPQPQSAPATGSASPLPDVTVNTGEPAPAQTAPSAALAAGSARLPVVTADPVMTTGTDTTAAAAKAGQTTTADAANPNSPRFTPGSAAHLAAQISQRFNNGSRVFGIRLDPAELGRVDIRMELTHNNRVHATLTVERGDTLAELQRSTRDLERALNEAGLELAEDGLSFELGAGSGEQDPAEGKTGQQFNIYGPDDGDEQMLAAEIGSAPVDTYGFRLSRRDSVDVRV
ncbi:flagellar hook-length control protein FliK [Maricaulis sp.]|uniref:flagellar hook-length control protein FliK n=1 Tax=Maricaulis sp. TaxID=1486257 RepID=UPI003A8FBD21